MDAVTPKAERTADRHSHVVRPAGMEWQKTRFAGCEVKPLLFDRATGLVTALMRFAPGAVNLRVQTIKRPHPVSTTEQCGGTVGSDETGSPRDQNMFSHRWLRELLISRGSNTVLQKRFKRFARILTFPKTCSDRPSVVDQQVGQACPSDSSDRPSGPVRDRATPRAVPACA